MFFAPWDEAARGVKLALVELGAVSIRAAAIAVSGGDLPHDIVVQPTLLTQADLRQGKIRTIEELNARLAAFGHSAAATARWIPGQ